MRLLLSVSVLGHLCVETSVGCLRKETCRAASPGLGPGPFLSLESWKMRRGGRLDPNVGSVWMWGFDGAALCLAGTRGRCWLCEVQRHHQLHLWHRSHSDQEKTPTAAPSGHLASAAIISTATPWELSTTLTSWRWHMTNGCVERFDAKHHYCCTSIGASDSNCIVL